MAHVADDTVNHSVVEHVDQPLQKRGNSYGYSYLEKNCENSRHIYVARTYRKVDSITDEYRNVECKSYRNCGEDERNDKVEAVFFEVFQHLEEGGNRTLERALIFYLAHLLSPPFEN